MKEVPDTGIVGKIFVGSCWGMKYLKCEKIRRLYGAIPQGR